MNHFRFMSRRNNNAHLHRAPDIKKAWAAHNISCHCHLMIITVAESFDSSSFSSINTTSEMTRQTFSQQQQSSSSSSGFIQQSQLSSQSSSDPPPFFMPPEVAQPPMTFSAFESVMKQSEKSSSKSVTSKQSQQQSPKKMAAASPKSILKAQPEPHKKAVGFADHRAAAQPQQHEQQQQQSTISDVPKYIVTPSTFDEKLRFFETYEQALARQEQMQMMQQMYQGSMLESSQDQQIMNTNAMQDGNIVYVSESHLEEKVPAQQPDLSPTQPPAG